MVFKSARENSDLIREVCALFRQARPDIVFTSININHLDPEAGGYSHRDNNPPGTLNMSLVLGATEGGELVVEGKGGVELPDVYQDQPSGLKKGDKLKGRKLENGVVHVFNAVRCAHGVHPGWKGKRVAFNPFVHGCLKDYMFYTEGTPSEEVIEELEDLGFPIRETLAYLEEVEGTYNSEGEALLPIGGASVSEAPPQLAVSVNDSQVAEMCFTLECPLADVEPCNLELIPTRESLAMKTKEIWKEETKSPKWACSRFHPSSSVTMCGNS